MVRSPSRVVLVALVLAVAGSASRAQAGSSVSDAYTCIRVKDLKNPVPIEITPNPTFVGVTQGGGSGDCQLRKVTQVCLPSSVNTDVPLNTTDAKCCFKVKCDRAIGDLPSVAIADDGGGAGSFQGMVSLSKASLVCVPCTFAP